MPHTGGPPPIGMPVPPVHTPEYSGLYPPYRGPGIGRPMYYTTYYAYPTPGMPMTGAGYISRPQPSAMFVQPSATTRGPPSTLDGNQRYYPGATTYSSQAGLQVSLV